MKNKCIIDLSEKFKTINNEILLTQSNNFKNSGLLYITEDDVKRINAYRNEIQKYLPVKYKPTFFDRCRSAYYAFINC